MASKDTAIAAIMEQLMAEGPQAMAPVVTALMNLAMRMEREQFLGAGHYERSSGRRGYANGAKLKKIDTPAGTLTLEVPKTAGTQKPFFPQSLERGRRACRAVMLCAAEMYVKGVSTRAVEKVLAEFGIEGLSSTQVSRAAALLDDELEAWRDRPLGCFRYLFLDARYEKTREHGVADDCAVLSAIGIEPSGKRRILGLSVAFSEAEVHWRAFLESLVARGLQGVEFITSDDHPGLKAARQAVLPGARWQRCQFHLAQNAIHHAPNQAIRKAIGEELRAVWDAPSLGGAEEELKPRGQVPYPRAQARSLARKQRSREPCRVQAAQGPSADHANRPHRALDPARAKRRTRKIRVFPNEASLVRLVSAILVEMTSNGPPPRNPMSTSTTPMPIDVHR